MAFSTYKLWLITFRVPADDFQHLHIMQMNAPGNEGKVRAAFLNRHANPDARIESIATIKSPTETADLLAKVMKEAGPAYRPLQKDEAHLTIADVARIQGRAIPAIEKSAVTAPEAAARARSESLVTK
jgi:hypothetical protein